MAAKKGGIIDSSDFHPSEDAKALYNALTGPGTDEETVINVITHRTLLQRQSIAQAYNSLYDKDLKEDLRSDLTGDFESVIIGLMYPVSEVLAKYLNKSIKGAGTNEAALSEIIASSNKDGTIGEVKKAYDELFGSSLPDDLIAEAKGYFGQFLSALTMDIRSEKRDVEDAAKVLINGGEAEWGHILSTEIYPNLLLIFAKYETLASQTVEKAIGELFSGDIQLAFSTVVKCARDLKGYFAERLHDALKGAGTDEDTLIRIIVTRNEIDLNLISIKFQQKYSKTLREEVADDTSGDFQRALLSLLE